ncbi:hypothetical protein HPB49_007944 [Dermacentor silvarum]|uniref:Uncharacterized protein n=1 Tax=Dermacentor silvarum TaxID=543639 RepID=A0ACB8C2K7_DERSI|nr:hypothetical protein HPB49_007944 [Dermacentor silvarum]
MDSMPSHRLTGQGEIADLQCASKITCSDLTAEYGTLRELLIKEQFLISGHPSLSLYLKERKAKSLQDMLELADQFLEAQGGTNLSRI